jgi:hypothetical protein
MSVEFQFSDLSQDVDKLIVSENCVALAVVALKTGCDAEERRKNLPTFTRKFCFSFLW